MDNCGLFGVGAGGTAAGGTAAGGTAAGGTAAGGTAADGTAAGGTAAAAKYNEMKLTLRVKKTWRCTTYQFDALDLSNVQ
jgi:hypothetical protein